jgi:hypothetical protein
LCMHCDVPDDALSDMKQRGNGARGELRRHDTRPLLPRELQSRTASFSRCRSRQVFGLMGRWPVLGRFLLHAASRTCDARLKIQCQWHGSFPLTAAGQLRTLIGFPLRPSTCGRHRDDTQDMVFSVGSQCGGRILPLFTQRHLQSMTTRAMPDYCYRSSSCPRRRRPSGRATPAVPTPRLRVRTEEDQRSLDGSTRRA